MKFRKAIKNDAARIMEIINEAKTFLKESGVDQWQTGYPDQTTIDADIETQNGYVLEDNGRVIAYFYVTYGIEEFQKHINGAWKSDLPSSAIHRMAIDNSYKGKGLADSCFRFAENLSMEKGYFSVKLDTDADNGRMRHVLEKNGYEYCGIVRFDNSDKVAYEKILK